MTEIQRIPDIKDFPSDLRGAVVAIGNFDGVHRGHQFVLARALELARQEKRPAVVLTFEPHPRQVFLPDAPLYRLSDASMKARLLGVLGFDGVVEQTFSHDFASLSPQEFETDVLYEALGAAHVVTGFDFQYGKSRGGSVNTLAAASERLGFVVTTVSKFVDEGGDVISSSRIRQMLSDGRVSEAAGLLGYRYTVESEIIGGKKLGRTLGFPTANMAVPDDIELAHGIYAVHFRREDGSLYDGVASFGRRPTVDSDGHPLLETFLFDFSDDLYGEKCCVSFFGFLRGEVKFDGLDALIIQMKRDEEEARALLGGVSPFSALDAAIAFKG